MEAGQEEVEGDLKTICYIPIEEALGGEEGFHEICPDRDRKTLQCFINWAA